MIMMIMMIIIIVMIIIIIIIIQSLMFHVSGSNCSHVLIQKHFCVDKKLLTLSTADIN